MKGNLCKNYMYTLFLPKSYGIEPLGMAAPRSEVAGAAADSVFAVEFLTTGIVVFTDDVISSANFESSAFNQIGCDFLSGIRVHALDCRTRYMHLFGALFLSETDVVD